MFRIIVTGWCRFIRLAGTVALAAVVVAVKSLAAVLIVKNCPLNSFLIKIARCSFLLSLLFILTHSLPPLSSSTRPFLLVCSHCSLAAII